MPVASVGRHSAILLLKRGHLSVYLAGQSFSYLGTWVQIIALSWVVLQMTDSPLAVGGVAAAATVPAVFISPIAGAVADRIGKRKILMVVQLGRALSSSAFGLATIFGFGLPSYFALAVVAGVLSAIDTPIRQSLMYELGGKDHVADSAALNALTFNVARVLSGPVSGFLLVVQGASSCFFLNAITYMGVLVSLAFITEPTPPRLESKDRSPNVFGGLRAAWNDRQLNRLFISLAIYSISTLNHIQLFTVYVRFSLNAGAAILGDLVGWLGTGALISSAALLWMDRSHLRALHLTAFTLPCCFMVLAGTRSVVVAEFTACIFGAALVQYLVRISALVQTFASADNRGSVTGLYSMCLIGATPISVLLSGAIAQYLGVTTALLSEALAALVGFAVLVRPAPALRPQY